MAKVKGKWIFNTTLTDAGTEGSVVSGQTVSFTSNGGVFDRIIPLSGYQSVMTYSNIEYSYSVYTHSDGWTNEAFKVIDFDATEQEVSAEFYAWLTKNAAPEGSESGEDPDPDPEPNPEPTPGLNPEAPTDEYYLIKKSTLDGIADAVRSKTGKTAQMRGLEIAGEIWGINSLIEAATEAEMTALLSTASVGSVCKYTGTTGTYENGALYIVEEVA